MLKTLQSNTTIIAAAMFMFLAGTAPSAWAADTPVYTIQGSGNTSPLVGQTVTTTGVVTKLNNFHTPSLGCAPTPSQYFARDRSRATSLYGLALRACSVERFVGRWGRGL